MWLNVCGQGGMVRDELGWGAWVCVWSSIDKEEDYTIKAVDQCLEAV